jgi:hypothetical protein
VFVLESADDQPLPAEVFTLPADIQASLGATGD